MPEFLFLADAAGSEFGTAALFNEVAGGGAGLTALDLVGTNTLGGLGGLLGGGVGAAGTGLGAGNIAGGLGSITAAAPEAAAQITAAQQAAATGANQIAPELAGNLGTPAQSAMNAASQNFAPDRFAGAQELFNPEAVPAQSAMMQGGPEAIPMNTTAAEYPTGIMGGAPQSSGGLGDLFSGIKDWWGGLKPQEKMLYGGAAALGANTLFGSKPNIPQTQPYSGPLSKFHYDPAYYKPTAPAQPTPYQPVYQNYRSYAGGGPVEQMANANAIGQNTGFPQAALHQGAYATPWQTPVSQNVLSGPADTNVDPYTGEERFAAGGISSLGGYSDGGRMLKGPGDGMSDDIPATIANKQPARLANDEFVVPADVVSHLGNGSSDAGAKQLYKMMDRVRQARTGKKAQGKEINPDKYMPA